MRNNEFTYHVSGSSGPAMNERTRNNKYASLNWVYIFRSLQINRNRSLEINQLLSIIP